MKWLAMIDPTDFGIALYVILVFVAFISGMFLGASISRNRRKEREHWYARPIAAKEGLGSEGKVRSPNVLAFVIAFVVGVVVIDHFFPGVFYLRK